MAALRLALPVVDGQEHSPGPIVPGEACGAGWPTR